MNRSDVESFFWGVMEQLLGSFSGISAHQDFQMSEFFLPELLLKELCIMVNRAYKGWTRYIWMKGLDSLKYAQNLTLLHTET